jgi:hypothetical protein
MPDAPTSTTSSNASLDQLMPPDVGYSSGENSMHEHVNCDTRALLATGALVDDAVDLCKNVPSVSHHDSPLKTYYKMTPLDDAGRVTDFA